MSEKILQIKNLYKKFGNKEVLQGINLDLNSTENLVILGGSGSGKSVFIKNIVGLLIPDKGEILFHNQNLVNAKNHKYKEFISQIGYLFQGGALFDSLKIWENIAFALTNNLNYSKKKAYDIALENLYMVGLEENVAHLYPAEISGGMIKRVALARAIVLKPKLIFFDEPTAGLDPVNANIINRLIRDTSKKLGSSTITITHDMNTAKIVADKVAFLYQGKIIWQDRIDNLFATENKIVKKFVSG